MTFAISLPQNPIGYTALPAEPKGNRSTTSKTHSFAIKRIFDITFSLVVLTALSPVYLTIALVVFVSDPHSPVIFAHKRMGLHGKPFNCYKFRTMHPNAGALLEAVLQENPNLADEWKKYSKLKTDPRVTWIGRFLRKSSADELPQFVNVVLGDMSVVGPRPATKQELEAHCPTKKRRKKLLSVLPGITGLSQITARGAPLEKRISRDLEYVKHRSFAGDCLIVAQTVPVVLSRKGAC